MKAVMLSIQPKWCEKIASGKKTVEVRKTRPKTETPFPCFIYETQGRTETPWIDEDGHEIFKGRGQVIGEFVCDAIISHCEMANADIAEQQGCIRREKLFEYANGKELYGWHISDLVIYDKPKELGEFFKACDKPPLTDCSKCYERGENTCKPLSRPPQSWCYVEAQE